MELDGHQLAGRPLIARRAVFFFMLLTAFWNFFLNLAARYKEHPFDNINGFPLWALNIITSAMWTVCTILYIGITWHYAKEHPYWSVGALVIALCMTWFMVWAGLDLFDWFVWGPLIVDLGIIVRAGIEAVATSDQSGMLRTTWNGFWGYEPQPRPPPQLPPQNNPHDVQGDPMAIPLENWTPQPHNDV